MPPPPQNPRQARVAAWRARDAARLEKEMDPEYLRKQFKVMYMEIAASAGIICFISLNLIVY